MEPGTGDAGGAPDVKRGGGAILIAGLFALAILIMLAVALLRGRGVDSGSDQPSGTQEGVQGDPPTGRPRK
jgi:hypothetical protein